MKADCPSCGYVFSRRERGRFFGGNPWRPRAAPCPSCGTSLRWVAWAWRLQLAALVAILFCVFRGFPIAVRAGAGILALVAAVIVLAGLRLERAEPGGGQPAAPAG